MVISVNPCCCRPQKMIWYRNISPRMICGGGSGYISSMLSLVLCVPRSPLSLFWSLLSCVLVNWARRIGSLDDIMVYSSLGISNSIKPPADGMLYVPACTTTTKSQTTDTTVMSLQSVPTVMFEMPISGSGWVPVYYWHGWWIAMRPDRKSE